MTVFTLNRERAAVGRSGHWLASALVACLFLSSAVAALACSTGVSFARDNLQIAGSSTVLPYATIVAELFAENSGFAAPVVEGGGSGCGFAFFWFVSTPLFFLESLCRDCK